MLGLKYVTRYQLSADQQRCVVGLGQGPRAPRPYWVPLGPGSCLCGSAYWWWIQVELSWRSENLPRFCFLLASPRALSPISLQLFQGLSWQLNSVELGLGQLPGPCPRLPRCL